MRPANQDHAWLSPSEVAAKLRFGIYYSFRIASEQKAYSASTLNVLFSSESGGVNSS